MDAALAQNQADELEEEDGFDLANILPEDTGLSMVVWISDGQGVRHDVRVKISEEHGSRVRTDRWAVMSVRPTPELIHGDLSSRDVDAVRRWILLNEPVIMAYWQGELATKLMLNAIQPI